MTKVTRENALELLTAFVNQRPGLDFANYGDSKSYNAESREITKDRADYFELVAWLADRCKYGRAQDTPSARVFGWLSKSTGRVLLVEGELTYHEGQYFPTEYRPAAARLVANIIWSDLSNERNKDGSETYPTADAMRKVARMRLSRRVYRNYFA